MYKPYITFKHIIVEIISCLLGLISIIIAIVLSVTIERDVPVKYSFSGEILEYGSAAEFIIVPIVLFATTVLICLLVHLLPPKSWNVPFKINPEKEISVYKEMSYMVIGISLIMSIASLGTVLFIPFSKSGASIINVGLLVFITLDIVIFGKRAKKANNI